jgi:predicted ferric reductase
MFCRMIVGLGWLAAQATTFAVTFVRIQSTPPLGDWRQRMGPGLAIAKASAQCINLTVALITLCMCPWTWSRCGRLFGLNMSWQAQVGAHRFLAYSLCAWTLVHVIAHYINFMRAFSLSAVARQLFLTGVGTTGHVLLLMLMLMMISAMVRPFWRRSWQTALLFHNLFFTALTWLLSVHGIFCFVRDSKSQCSHPTSGYWLVGPVALWWLDQAVRCGRLWRTSRHFRVVRVIAHPGKVMELHIDAAPRSASVFGNHFLGQLQCGQFVYLWVPRVSWLQRHPFTVTSISEEGYLSVHIRQCGRWTRQVCRAFGVHFAGDRSFGIVPFDKDAACPRVGVDGPYGDVFGRVRDYAVVVLVGAGIGQTPFVSVMKKLWYLGGSLSYTIILGGICTPKGRELY